LATSGDEGPSPGQDDGRSIDFFPAKFAGKKPYFFTSENISAVA
jgi:hypothetical protein